MGARAGLRQTWPPGICLALLLALPLWQAQLADYKTQFNHEHDPVRRAKLLTKLSAEEFRSFREAVDAADSPAALRLLGDYRDQLVDAQKALAASGVDAEKRPKGFKELQISLRENLRTLGDILLAIPADEREPFDAIRQQLERVNKQLILELFPRQPGASKEPKPKP